MNILCLLSPNADFFMFTFNLFFFYKTFSFRNAKGHDTIVTRAKKKSILDLKDKDFEEMPMEGIDWDQLTQEEKDHIKNWSEKRQLELQTAVEAAQMECCLTPIGMDRTYRRYWLFKSVPGLFVEDSKVQDFTIPSSCLNLVPQDPNKLKNYKRRDFKGDLSEEQEENDKKSLIYVNAHEQLASRGKTEWSLYSYPEELESLIESLNTRGHRENHLKNCLTRSKQKIIKSLTLCEVESLIKVEENIKQNNMHCFDYIRNMKGELELARTIADLLLDLEERIFAGSLGQLKVCLLILWVILVFLLGENVVLMSRVCNPACSVTSTLKKKQLIVWMVHLTSYGISIIRLIK